MTQRPPLLNEARRIEPPSVAFTVRGEDVRVVMDRVPAHDDTTHDSGSGGSGFSDLSALENDTDDFGRRILQHQRDARLNSVPRPGQQAFRKARPRLRMTERSEQGSVRRDGIRHGSQQPGQNDERPTSGGGRGSDLPVNVPAHWGRKARGRTDWLRTLQQRTESEAAQDKGHGSGEEQKPDEDAIIPHRTAYTGDEDWEAVLDSIETTPPRLGRQRAETTPSSSMRHMNTTLKEALASDDQDFTAASLLASTPAVNRHNRKVDELTQREIETVEKRGITRRTLDQIFDRSGSSNAEPRSSAKSPANSVPLNGRRRSAVAYKENLAPKRNANASATSAKGAEVPGLENRTTDPVTFKNVQRSAHMRSDSYNLLKQLARVSSMSRGPGKDRTDRDAPERRPKSESAADPRPLGAHSTNGDRNTGYSRGSDGTDQRRNPYPTPEAEQQKVVSRTQAQDAQIVEGSTPDGDATLVSQDSQKDTETPAVTGVWGDTPGANFEGDPLLNNTGTATVRAHGSRSGVAAFERQDDSVAGAPRRVHSEPVNARSALADVLKEIKSQPDGQFGDTTIQSLEDIMSPDLDSSDPTSTIDVGEIAQGVVSAIDSCQPMTEAEKDRRQESLAIEAMTKHLRAAKTSIKDANRGLRRVENRIETARTAPASSDGKPSPAQPPKIGPNGRTVCEHCGGTYYGSIWDALWVEFRSCFYTFDSPPSWHIRFTWLGLLSITFIVWYTTESTLCSYYCHPLFASSMKGYGVDPDAPIFPFVIPTLIFRPLKFLWVPALEGLAWCLGVLFSTLFGNNGSSSDWPAAPAAYGNTMARPLTNTAYGDWIATATAVTARVMGSASEAVDEAGSMWDDLLLS